MGLRMALGYECILYKKDIVKTNLSAIPEQYGIKNVRSL